MHFSSFITSKNKYLQRNNYLRLPDNFTIPNYGITSDVTMLALETVVSGSSCLVFCPSRDQSEKLAYKVAKEIYLLVKNDLGMYMY